MRVGDGGESNGPSEAYVIVCETINLAFRFVNGVGWRVEVDWWAYEDQHRFAHFS